VAAVHGLYWLTVNLAGRRPLLVTVDDVQWADVGSLRWLAYLARRLEGLPVLVVATVRSGEVGGAPTLLADLLAAGGWERVRPAPLGEDAAADLVRRDLTGATAGFCRACHTATGGNPFLLRALAVSLRADGIEPTDEAALEVAEFGPESVAVSLERRLAALPVGSGPFLEAVAVIGSDATLRHCAALAGLTLETAAGVRGRPDVGGLLVPPALDFAHTGAAKRPRPGGSASGPGAWPTDGPPAFSPPTASLPTGWLPTCSRRTRRGSRGWWPPCGRRPGPPAIAAPPTPPRSTSGALWPSRPDRPNVRSCSTNSGWR